jgi:hypothetical protein
MEFYKIEKYFSSHEVEKMKASITGADSFVTEKKVEMLKNLVKEMLTKYDKTEDFKEYLKECNMVSSTGWHYPMTLLNVRTEEEVLFDECIYWRNKYVELIHVHLE